MTDNNALEKMITEVAEAESQLATRKEELAKRDAEVADLFKAEKELSANVEALKLLIKDEMKREGISEWDGERATLKLTPTGKFRPTEGTSVDDICDEVCEIKRTLDNKKCKAYYELNGKLPDGVESSGDMLRINWK